jgi:phosphatidylglycerol:prolipoprotein diacylglycerol transferase
VLHKNFVRNGVDADALSVVAFVVIAGGDRREGVA